jgi:hypothetical protein
VKGTSTLAEPLVKLRGAIAGCTVGRREGAQRPSTRVTEGGAHARAPKSKQELSEVRARVSPANPSGVRPRARPEPRATSHEPRATSHEPRATSHTSAEVDEMLANKSNHGTPCKEKPNSARRKRANLKHKKYPHKTHLVSAPKHRLRPRGSRTLGLGLCPGSSPASPHSSVSPQLLCPRVSLTRGCY